MMYQFVELPDKTGIAHSDVYYENGREKVKVYIERPILGGFKSAECYLPDYEWKNIEGFTEEEMQYFEEFIPSVAHIIIELAREGGFVNASNIQIG